MTLLTRVGRLLRADLNAVLDGLEEPAALLRQAVRDMQAALDEEQREALRLRDEGQRLAQAAQDCRARLLALDEELTLCLAEGEEALARDVVRRKLETARQEAQLSDSLKSLDTAAQRLAARIAEHAGRLDALRAEASLYDTLDAAGDRGVPTVTAPISAAEIDVALLRERQRRVGA